MTFEVHFQLDFESYPERVTFTVSLQFGPVRLVSPKQMYLHIRSIQTSNHKAVLN